MITDHRAKQLNVPIHSINIGESRSISEESVAALASSIEDVGLINPLTVAAGKRDRGGCTRYELIAGQHRLRALMKLGWKQVPVLVQNLKGASLELAQLDENLCRNEGTALERAEGFARRKELYEQLHPETKKGGDRKSAQAKSKRHDVVLKDSFAEDTAKKTGATQRTVQRYVAIAKGLAPEARKLARAVPEIADDMTGLLELTRLPHEEQAKVVRAAARAEVPVKQAIRGLRRQEQVEQVKAYRPPEGQYEVISIDWPWKYEDAWADTGRELPYPTMTIEEICASVDTLPVAENCALFCWVTNPILLDPAGWSVVAAKLKERWGFVAKQIRTWVKTGDADGDFVGRGNGWRNDTEHLIRLERGKVVFHEMGAAHGRPIQRTSFRAPLGEKNSEKPAQAYRDIESLCASTSRLEMYARDPREGWVTSGAELAEKPEARAPDGKKKPAKVQQRNADSPRSRGKAGPVLSAPEKNAEGHWMYELMGAETLPPIYADECRKVIAQVADGDQIFLCPRCCHLALSPEPHAACNVSLRLLSSMHVIQLREMAGRPKKPASSASKCAAEGCCSAVEAGETLCVVHRIVPPDEPRSKARRTMQIQDVE